MKKLFVLFVFLCILLTGCNTETRYFFSKDTCSMRMTGSGPNGPAFDSPEELEESIRVSYGGPPSPYGIIAQCAVLDGSTNHPQVNENPASHAYYHVRTPIRIDKIFYAASGVSVSEGDSFVVIEPYWYDTAEDGTVVTDSSGKLSCLSRFPYSPLVAEKTYILYMTITPLTYLSQDRAKEAYDCGSDSIWRICNYMYSIYPIGTREEAEELLVTTNDAYWENWEYVMETYKA